MKALHRCSAPLLDLIAALALVCSLHSFVMFTSFSYFLGPERSGVNMYAMLTGRLPFASDDVPTLHNLIMEKRYRIPEKLSPGS